MTTQAPKIIIAALKVYKGEIKTKEQRKILQDDYRDKMTPNDWEETLDYLMHNKHNVSGIELKSLNTKIDRFGDFLQKHDIHDWHELETKLKGENLRKWYSISWRLFTSALEVAWPDYDGTTLHELFEVKNFLT